MGSQFLLTEMLNMALAGFLLVSVMAGVTRSEVSSCYKVDVTWTNSTVLDLVIPVLDYEECQTLCQARAGCEGWTWTGDENEEWQDHCLMFSDIGQTVSYPGCVSGPGAACAV